MRYRTPSGETISATQTFETKSEAAVCLSLLESDIRRGSWIDPRRGDITLKDFVTEYCAVVPKRPSTLARDRRVLAKHFVPRLGGLRLHEIRPSDIQRVINDMARDLEPKTVATDYGVLRAVLNAAVNDDRILRSPCRGIKLPRTPTMRRQVLNRHELDALATEMPLEYRLTVYLGGVLALRWSELVGLRVGDVDLLTRPARLTVAQAITEVEGKFELGPTKSSASDRSFGVPTFIAEMVAEHLSRRGLTGAHRDALLFEAPAGGPLRGSNFRTRVWKPAADAAGFEGFTFLGLRRSAMTMWAQIGMSPKAVQVRGGHSDPVVSQRLYQQYSDEMDQLSTRALEVAMNVTPQPAESGATG